MDGRGPTTPGLGDETDHPGKKTNYVTSWVPILQVFTYILVVDSYGKFAGKYTRSSHGC